jgi:hypothetical protein
MTERILTEVINALIIGGLLSLVGFTRTYSMIAACVYMAISAIFLAFEAPDEKE